MFISKFDNSLYFANTAALSARALMTAPPTPRTSRTFATRGESPARCGLRTSAASKLNSWRRQPDHDRRAKMTENALRLVREAGVTSFQDISDHEQLQLYHEFLEAGRLTARVNFRYGIEH